jgi:hypothetical protein
MNAIIRRTVTITLAALLGLLLAAGCSGQPSAQDSAGDDAGRSSLDGGGEDAPSDFEADRSATFSAAAPNASAEGAVTDRAVISTGALSLESPDVSAARQKAIDLVNQAGGHVDNEESLSGDDGRMTRSSLVFRVPAKQFASVMDQLADVAETVRQSRQAEDVTADVIDVAARIRVQESSIRRLELLYARATTIGQIISLESQLSRRQADVDSLKQRQAWLLNQTALSTIEVVIVEPDTQKSTVVRHGFMKGLYAGWDALVSMTMGILAALGAVLPFLGVLALLILAYRVTRRVRS